MFPTTLATSANTTELATESPEPRFMDAAAEVIDPINAEPRSDSPSLATTGPPKRLKQLPKIERSEILRPFELIDEATDKDDETAPESPANDRLPL